ncbi:MAG: hypothetical protein ABIU77_12840, partial [Ferruginibacter sp.]
MAGSLRGCLYLAAVTGQALLTRKINPEKFIFIPIIGIFGSKEILWQKTLPSFLENILKNLLPTKCLLV